MSISRRKFIIQRPGAYLRHQMPLDILISIKKFQSQEILASNNGLQRTTLGPDVQHHFASSPCSVPWKVHNIDKGDNSAT